MQSFDGDGRYWEAKRKSRKLFLEHEVNAIRKKLTSEEFYILKEYFTMEKTK